MQYTQQGETGINISKICVGCMSFGKPGTVHDWALGEERTDAVVAHALDQGITFFDTANDYSAGTSEEYPGKALRKHISRDQVVIASKVYFNEGRPFIQGHPSRDRWDAQATGHRLPGPLHHPQVRLCTPIEETMEALNDLVKAGKVPSLGASAMHAASFRTCRKSPRATVGTL